MAKVRVAITESYQKVSSGTAVITIAVQGEGIILLDETGDDDTAYSLLAQPGDQFEQTSNLDTYVRATGDGWVIVADGIL